MSYKFFLVIASEMRTAQHLIRLQEAGPGLVGDFRGRRVVCLHFVAAAQQEVAVLAHVGRLEPNLESYAEILALRAESDGKERGVVGEIVGNGVFCRAAAPMRHGAGDIVAEKLLRIV